MAEKHRAVLNKQQRKAVRYGTRKGRVVHRKPLVIVAGAGTGKTKTLAARIAHLLDCSADPRRMAVVTFTNRAATELKERVAKTVSQSTIEFGYAGTFHGWAARLLREFASEVGLSPNFTILDKAGAASLLNQLYKSEQHADKLPDIAKCQDIFSYHINSLKPLTQVLRERDPKSNKAAKQLKLLRRKYDREKKRQALLDFDDLLIELSTLLESRKLARKIRRRFAHVFVDEYQDCSSLQVKILRQLSPAGRGFTVVGDDEQAIYSFRGASAQNLQRFSSHYFSSSRRLALTQNYRSTQPILRVANAMMASATGNKRRPLWSKIRSGQKPRLTSVKDCREQARYVVDCIAKAQTSGAKFESHAILYRTSVESLPIEHELIRRNIPYTRSGGGSFLEKRHVRDVLGILQWFSNPRNRIAGRRTLMLLPGIGIQTADNHARSVSNAGHLRNLNREVSRTSRASVRSFVKVYRTIALRRWPAELAAIVSWYESTVVRSDDKSMRRDLHDLMHLATRYVTSDEMLTGLSADAVDVSHQTISQTRDTVTLSTIHSAKGKEWQSVFIINAVDGCIPNFRAGDVDEEKRVLHVGMTRAKMSLEVVSPKRVIRSNEGGYGFRVFKKPTRFIRNAPCTNSDWQFCHVRQ